MSIYLFLCLLFLVLIQGGYYPQTYIIVGIVSAVLLSVRRKKLTYSAELPALMILAILYVISAVVNGMSYSVISKAMLPLTLFVVAVLYAGLCQKQKEKLIKYITVAGVISGAVGIVMYSGMSGSEAVVAGNSLMFTFQYANAAGCWYAVSFVLAAFSDNRFIRYSSVLCLIALFLTKSYGALLILGVMLLVHFLRSDFLRILIGRKWYIKYIITVLLITGGCNGLYFLSVIGMDSLFERVIHSYDGIKVLMSDVVCGIGPDNWQYVFPFHQTAYYSAGVIHNSYVQAGVDAGIMSMIIMIALLIIAVYRYIKSRTVCNLAVVIIMLHSIMEYNLYFASLDVLLIFLSMYESRNNTYVSGEVRGAVSVTAGIVVICILSFALYGTGRVRLLESYIQSGDTKKAGRIFNENEIFMKNGYRENEAYGICSLVNGLDFRPGIQSARYRRYEMIYSENIDINLITDYIEEQKYNRNVRIEAGKLVDKLDVPDEQKGDYYEYVNAIDDSVTGWFGRIIRGE